MFYTWRYFSYRLLNWVLILYEEDRQPTRDELVEKIKELHTEFKNQGGQNEPEK